VKNTKTGERSISDWLDEKVAENLDVSHITLPEGLSYDQDPDETVFFEEIKPCGMLCAENHPLASVERFGHWYRSRGRDRDGDAVHTSKDPWWLFTKDRALAVRTAKSHLESK